MTYNVEGGQRARFTSAQYDRWAPRSSGISAVITRLQTAVHWNSNCYHCSDSQLYHGHQQCIFSCYLSLLFISVLEICPTLFLRPFTAGGRISSSPALSLGLAYSTICPFGSIGLLFPRNIHCAQPFHHWKLTRNIDFLNAHICSKDEHIEFSQTEWWSWKNWPQGPMYR